MTERIRFVNRKDELAWIKEALLDTEQAHARYLYADGGIGKTRLLQEIYAMLCRPDYKALLDIAPEEPLTIVVVNEFCHTAWADAFLRGVRMSATDMGIHLRIEDAEFDIPTMIEQLEDVIQHDPDAIIVRLGTDPRLRPALQKAIAQGIKVLTLDNFLRSMGNLTTRIVTNEDAHALLAARQLIEDIHRQGVVAILTGKQANLPERRRKLLSRFMTPYPDIELVIEELTMEEGMAEKAYHSTCRLLKQYPKLKALWVTWDEFTDGVIRALRDTDRVDVGVYGFDVLSLSDFERLAEADSPWRASVALDPEFVGHSVIHLAALAACNKSIQRHYEMPAHFLNRDTLSQFPKMYPHLSQTDPPYIPNLITLDIVDFEEQACHDELMFALKLATMIGGQYFGDFYRELQNFTELRTQEISRYMLDKNRMKVERAFINCLQQVATQQRTVLILDTIEKAHEVVPFIANMLQATPNIVTVIAGRPDPASQQLLTTTLGDRLQCRPLEPLDEEASIRYLQEKQENLHIFLEQEFKENLLELAKGKPILMDLAVEWHARGLVLPWARNGHPMQSAAESKAVPWDHEEDFESQLVRHIGQVKNLVDWVTLLLAYVYPLGKWAIAQFLDLTNEETERMWDELQTLVFIKHLPQKRVTLHDKMRELVNTYVWPDFDRDGSRRYEISQAALAYLEKQINQRQMAIADLSGKPYESGNILAAQLDLESWRQCQEHIEAIWLLREQLLRHQLVVDLGAGLDLFFDLYEDATQDYRYVLRLSWVELVMPYLTQLDPKNQCEVLLCKAKALLDEGKYADAKDILEHLTRLPEIEPFQEADIYIQLANVVIRQGWLKEGIQKFEKAVEISQTAEDKQWRVKAENGLGWAYRLTADLNKALEHYEIALGLALEENAYPEQQALLYNNLGFLYAYQREKPDYLRTAQRFCEESLRLARELNNERGVGRAYSTMGCVSFMGGQLERALENFELALEIFEPKGDEEWLSQIYAWRGATWLGLGNPNMDIEVAESEPERESWVNMNIEAAERDLERARQINIPKDQPVILSRLALVYLLKGKYSEAEDLVQECRDWALKLPDLWYQWITIRDLARVARHRNQFSCLSDFEQLRKVHLEQWPNVDRRAHGMLMLELGCLALGLSEQQKAVDYFMEGMKILISIGEYGGDRPAVFLERIEQQFFLYNSEISQAQIAALGHDLVAAWKSEALYILYPDIRNIYAHWANWQEESDG